MIDDAHAPRSFFLIGDRSSGAKSRAICRRRSVDGSQLDRLAGAFQCALVRALMAGAIRTAE